MRTPLRNDIRIIATAYSRLPQPNRITGANEDPKGKSSLQWRGLTVLETVDSTTRYQHHDDRMEGSYLDDCCCSFRLGSGPETEERNRQ